MNVLSCQNVSLKRAAKTILVPFDLELDVKGITCLLGPNGAGKSVFLNLCHGMFAPDTGTVLWNGQPAQATRRQRSFMFQTSAIMRRSVRANIGFPLLAQKVAGSDRRARVDEALNFARLTERAKQPAALLSGGEKQRMALARAWVTRPKAILLDEPAASLDPASTRAFEDMLKGIAANSGVILATHNIGQAKRLADHILFFANGELVANDTADRFFGEKHSGQIADYLDGKI